MSLTALCIQPSVLFRCCWLHSQGDITHSKCAACSYAGGSTSQVSAGGVSRMSSCAWEFMCSFWKVDWNSGQALSDTTVNENPKKKKTCLEETVTVYYYFRLELFSKQTWIRKVHNVLLIFSLVMGHQTRNINKLCFNCLFWSCFFFIGISFSFLMLGSHLLVCLVFLNFKYYSHLGFLIIRSVILLFMCIVYVCTCCASESVRIWDGLWLALHLISI